MRQGRGVLPHERKCGHAQRPEGQLLTMPERDNLLQEIFLDLRNPQHDAIAAFKSTATIVSIGLIVCHAYRHTIFLSVKK